MAEVREDNGRKAAEKGAKPVLSMLGLYAMCSIYKILVALAGMAIAEGVSFYAVCSRLEQREEVVYPEKLADICCMQYIFLAALAVVYFILLMAESERGGSKSSYTLLRLRLSVKRQFAVKTVYNFLCLMLVFAWQTLTALAICGLYKAWMPARLVSPQYLFLTFYRNAFLHCLLPMEDAGRWVCNILLLLALAMDAACNSGNNGRKKAAGAGRAVNSLLVSIFIFIVLAQWFVSEIGSFSAVVFALLCLMIMGGALLRLFGVIGGGDREEA